MDITIDAMRPDDWPAVRAIFAEGIATGQATFETEAPEFAAWDAGHLAAPRLVARCDAALVGWAALSPVSQRGCYSGVAEVSIYITKGARGRGVGTRLLEALVADAEARGLWMLQAAVFPENEASVLLHLRSGFRVVGRRERIARLDGLWRDTLLMERRSLTVGTEPRP
jgi:L-amino acid N-acyltransferase YncA